MQKVHEASDSEHTNNIRQRELTSNCLHNSFCYKQLKPHIVGFRVVTQCTYVQGHWRFGDIS
jgi:hypothetical protein